MMISESPHFLSLSFQGVQCKDCRYNAHKKCSEKVPRDCTGEVPNDLADKTGDSADLDQTNGDESADEDNRWVQSNMAWLRCTLSFTSENSFRTSPEETGGVSPANFDPEVRHELFLLLPPFRLPKSLSLSLQSCLSFGGGSYPWPFYLQSPFLPSFQARAQAAAALPNIPVQRLVQSVKQTKRIGSKVLKEGWLVHYTNKGTMRKKHYWRLDTKSVTLFQVRLDLKERINDIVQGGSKEAAHFELILDP